MDFDITPEQRDYCEAVRRLGRETLSPGARERDAAHELSREAWQACARIGLQGLPVPEAYGGSAAGAQTIMLALEALGQGCTDNGLIFALNAQLWAVEVPLVRFGSEEHKQRWLPGLCDGTLVAGQAMSEPGAGSDAFSLTTTARPHRNGYVLDGRKTFVTGAPEADLLLIYASTDPAVGFAGISAFLVERDTPGCAIGPPMDKMGLRTSPMGEVFLDGCELPASSMLGPPGAGMAMFNLAMLWERGCILAGAVGTMRRQLERSVAYARERRQFGQPIGRNQAVSHRIVDMTLRLETCRLLLLRLGWLLDRGEATAADAALVKLHLSESFVQSSLDALQLHGGYGYMTELELERDVRDAVATRIHSGTSEMQRQIVAASLRL